MPHSHSPLLTPSTRRQARVNTKAPHVAGGCRDLAAAIAMSRAARNFRVQNRGPRCCSLTLSPSDPLPATTVPKVQGQASHTSFDLQGKPNQLLEGNRGSSHQVPLHSHFCPSYGAQVLCHTRESSGSLDNSSGANSAPIVFPF